MKVIIKNVVIGGKEFVLIKDKTVDGEFYYATIPCEELDDQGRLKKQLSGGEMCAIVNFLNESEEQMINEAINFRKDKIVVNNFRMSHPKATEEELINFILTLDTQFRKITR